jgi:hypothetical protein
VTVTDGLNRLLPNTIPPVRLPAIFGLAMVTAVAAEAS